MLTAPLPFPRYTDFEPKVPVWRVTPNRPGCIVRFFDTCPFSPSGRYLAAFQLPHEDRAPEPGDVGHIILVDLETGEDKVVADTRGWEPQMGANINWGASDHELFFNDMSTDDWRPFAWKLDPLSGQRQQLDGAVYHASPDGRWLVSPNLATMRRTQPGYGAPVPRELVRCNRGPVDDDGFYLTDAQTGQCRLLVSTRELIEKAAPGCNVANPDQLEIYGFHCKFNPQGDRVMLSLRMFPAGNEPGWNYFAVDHDAVQFAWFTMKLDGSELHCATPVEVWRHGGHHATWFPDGQHISMNARPGPREEHPLRFMQVNYDGSDFRLMVDGVIGSGHPIVHPDGRHLLTDAYNNEPITWDDGTIPIRWVDLQTGAEETLVRILTDQPCADRVMRVDPHPCWSRDYRHVAFNAFVGGARGVFIADVGGLV